MNGGIEKAAQVIRESHRFAVFTGAGISAGSGIPVFRGDGGLWEQYNPQVLELEYFFDHPDDCWKVLAELFYAHIEHAMPNAAHHALADLEAIIGTFPVITQNIDGFHQMAGSSDVIEYHGTLHQLKCLVCDYSEMINFKSLLSLTPTCPLCKTALKPDFVFFGEGIPPNAQFRASDIANSCDVLLVIGTSGEVMPAAMIPKAAMHQGATVIEINVGNSVFSNQEPHIFLQGKAEIILPAILEECKIV